MCVVYFNHISLVSSLGTVTTVGMPTDGFRITSEGSQMTPLFLGGSPQMNGGGGGVRTHGGIDTSGNKNTAVMVQGNSSKDMNSNNLSRHGILEQLNTEKTKVGDSTKIYVT